MKFSSKQGQRLIRYFATCPRGLEKLLADELLNIGGQAIEIQASGVHFEGDWRLGMRANLYSRVASRILQRVGHGAYRGEDDLYALVNGVPWERWFNESHSLRVDVSSRRSDLKSLQFMTLRAKDAICDRFRGLSGQRPSIDKVNPDIRVMLFVDDRFGTVYLDLSGEALFKRGWRLDKGPAPIKENLAAALVLLSGWKPDQVLFDPMCGSGTVLIEAALIAQNVPPGIHRHFAFEKFNTFDKYRWIEVRQEAKDQMIPVASGQLKLFGSDYSEHMIDLASQNAERARVPLRLRVGDARVVPPPKTSAEQGGTIITNPPYEERVAVEGQNTEVFFSEWASHLKKNFTDWSCWVISNSSTLTKDMHLRPSQKIPVFNGDLECKLYQFVMKSGVFSEK